ncbi:hypothetical protein [Prosthecomicrobium hirschii]|uniref:hypothetical protein n=1 Tax=Prosthecodimorpha hirschii TaxID=665126 RepID=UPI00221EB987|nr:hypothetical protein [Prosthecomicrobium hirschii]MCW1839838.1 hypothetical protein [Prosthecomicrobium hirschii]
MTGSTLRHVGCGQEGDYPAEAVLDLESTWAVARRLLVDGLLVDGLPDDVLPDGGLPDDGVAWEHR